MRNFLFAFIILLFAVYSSGICEIHEFPVGHDATADKPQSKVWYHDAIWWCILYDGVEGSYFYRLSGDSWEKGTFPDARVYPTAYTRADVLSSGPVLFVLEWESTSPRLYKYEYDGKNKAYDLLPGFPVDLRVPKEHETMVIAQDSTGKLWIPFELDGKVRVIYSISADHRSWDTAGIEIADGLKDDDIASIIAFDDQIGVFWSNQKTESLHFRIHRDNDTVDKWQEPETVVSGQLAADDHINLALSDDGRIFAVTKTSVDDAEEPVCGPTQAQFILNVRSADGIWKFYDVSEVSSVFKTRPIVVLDEENDDIYIFYREDKSIMMKRSPMSDIDFNDPPVEILAVPDVTLNNVTSTKQNVTSKTDLLIMATGSDNKAYSYLINIGSGIYVSPDGSDSNVGSIDSPGGAMDKVIVDEPAVPASLRKC